MYRRFRGTFAFLNRWKIPLGVRQWFILRVCWFRVQRAVRMHCNSSCQPFLNKSLIYIWGSRCGAVTALSHSESSLDKLTTYCKLLGTSHCGEGDNCTTMAGTDPSWLCQSYNKQIDCTVERQRGRDVEKAESLEIYFFIYKICITQVKINNT